MQCAPALIDRETRSGPVEDFERIVICCLPPFLQINRRFGEGSNVHSKSALWDILPIFRARGGFLDFLAKLAKGDVTNTSVYQTVWGGCAGTGSNSTVGRGR
jgi:hypothetical protein